MPLSATLLTGSRSRQTSEYGRIAARLLPVDNTRPVNRILMFAEDDLEGNPGLREDLFDFLASLAYRSPPCSNYDDLRISEIFLKFYKRSIHYMRDRTMDYIYRYSYLRITFSDLPPTNSVSACICPQAFVRSAIARSQSQEDSEGVSSGVISCWLCRLTPLHEVLSHPTLAHLFSEALFLRYCLVRCEPRYQRCARSAAQLAHFAIHMHL